MWCKRDPNSKRDPGFRSFDIVWVSFEFWVSLMNFGLFSETWVSFFRFGSLLKFEYTFWNKKVTAKCGVKETQT